MLLIFVDLGGVVETFSGNSKSADALYAFAIEAMKV